MRYEKGIMRKGKLQYYFFKVSVSIEVFFAFLSINIRVFQIKSTEKVN